MAWGKLEDFFGKQDESPWTAPIVSKSASVAPSMAAQTPSRYMPPIHNNTIFKEEDNTGFPPLPVVTESVTPVGRVKNATAQYNEYSPQGAKALYKTPVNIRFGHIFQDPPNPEYPNYSGSEDVAGFYRGPQPEDNPSQYEIRISGGENPQGRTGWENSIYSQILAHEFAHKWEDKMLPENRHVAWDEGGWNNASPYAINRAEGRLNDPSHPISVPTEIYAHNVERGPWTTTRRMRDDYYPGLFGEHIFDPKYRLLTDERPAMRMMDPQMAARQFDVPFGVEYWVKPQGVFHYYEDGYPITWQDGEVLPAQWSNPRFPSLRLYSETGN